jgi:transcriptional regulator GlxA family with amidase domain
MKIAILTFDGFNEIDSLVAAHILNRVQVSGWKAEITTPTPTVTSMNGVTIAAQRPLEFASEADAVIVGSGRKTQQVIDDVTTMSRLRLSPDRQLIASQCSGALALERLGLLQNLPACTDLKTRPALEATGVRVLDGPFYAWGNIATAGGCLSGQYLAAWIIWRLVGKEAVREALSYVVPVGQEEEYISRAMSVVGEYMERKDDRDFLVPQPQRVRA